MILIGYLVLPLQQLGQFFILMSHVINTLQRTKLQQFAEKEFAGAPLTAHTHVRVPARLKTFIGTIALVEEVSESTVFRYALEHWAAAQGYETQRGD